MLFFFGVSWALLTSMKRPPPPGPPGTYLRFFEGGAPSGESTAERETFEWGLGLLPDSLPGRLRRELGAIVHRKVWDQEDELPDTGLQIAA